MQQVVKLNNKKSEAFPFHNRYTTYPRRRPGGAGLKKESPSQKRRARDVVVQFPYSRCVIDFKVVCETRRRTTHTHSLSPNSFFATQPHHHNHH